LYEQFLRFYKSEIPAHHASKARRAGEIRNWMAWSNQGFVQCGKFAILSSSATHRNGRRTKWKAMLFQNRTLAQRVHHQKCQYSPIPKLQEHNDDNNQLDSSIQVQAANNYSFHT
jgi:hypothetical protein